ncbi:DNA polymerase I [Algisphaera agarilytica]|uniref:DNA polymerase I n=1 Tax=Algisphaera agarilytica TaxID=1385975 RepID=A0A7X0LJ30_9BACT|nr:DNA polymerase I [Algisphaera agarilytica]MBB6428417.1 DNA polymerase-1 [Algisphaera agarilytica]
MPSDSPNSAPNPSADHDQTLYLIDGHAQMFRAYHAIRGGMTSPITGEPTNATFAFAGLLLKLFTQYKPRYVAMAIDSKGDTFRHSIYPEYKANRGDPPEDFAPQIPRMIEVAELMGIPVLAVPGDEADDIMATLAVRLTSEDDQTKVRLVAKDKDLEQVMSDRVTLFDAHTDVEFDIPALQEKRGITPEQVIDYQTLLGDSTDNIPGVKGIGPKTASKLLDQFGSVVNLLDNLDQLKGKQKENLENAKADGSIDVTRQLVTLKRDTEIDFEMDHAKVDLSKIDAAKLDELFQQLGFNRHRADLKKLVAVPEPKKAKPAKKESTAGMGGLFDQPADDEGEDDTAATTRLLDEIDGDYSAITTKKQLADLVKTLKKQPIIAVDTETVGLGHTAELCGICLAWETGKAVYVPTKSPEPKDHLDQDTVIEALRPVFEDASLPKVGHNIKYDWLVLKHAGVELKGVTFDTMIAAFLCGAPGLGMDHLALSEFGRTMVPISRLIGEKPRRKADPPQKTMDQVPLDLCTAYSAEDADVTLQLYELFRGRLDEFEMTDLAAEVEMPLVEVLSTMEANGIRVDPNELDRQKAELEVRIEELRAQVLDAARVDFNPDSPKQLGDVLFNQLGFPVQKKTKTGYSTDAEVLEKLADLPADELEKVAEHARPIPKLIVEYRMLTKLVGTYFGNLVEAISSKDDRIHASFHQTGAATGRLSSSNPNLQNIPIRTEVGRRIRKAFVAEQDHILIAADYSQIELRMLAHLSEDPALIEAFREDRDIHTAVAAQVYGVGLDDVTSEQRGHAKTINFGIIYGVTPFGLARRIEGLDMAGATKLIDDYKTTYAGINRFLDDCVEQAVAQGYVTTILGRRRWIDQVNSSNPNQRALGERLAINSVVQGSAADLIKVAMVNLHRTLLDDSVPAKMLLQIHDELVIECPASEQDAVSKVVVDAMESAMQLKVPLKVEPGIGTDWFEAK